MSEFGRACNEWSKAHIEWKKAYVRRRTSLDDFAKYGEARVKFQKDCITLEKVCIKYKIFFTELREIKLELEKTGKHHNLKLIGDLLEKNQENIDKIQKCFK